MPAVEALEQVADRLRAAQLNTVGTTKQALRPPWIS
jgi:hypothetical protein